jgi:hypothetical protein
MKCQDFHCLLLGMNSCDLDANVKLLVCRHQAAVVSQWPLSRLVQPPGPRAEFKQNTNDELKAHLTDIMWIIIRSLVLR